MKTSFLLLFRFESEKTGKPTERMLIGRKERRRETVSRTQVFGWMEVQSYVVTV